MCSVAERTNRRFTLNRPVLRRYFEQYPDILVQVVRYTETLKMALEVGIDGCEALKRQLDLWQWASRICRICGGLIAAVGGMGTIAALTVLGGSYVSVVYGLCFVAKLAGTLLLLAGPKVAQLSAEREIKQFKEKCIEPVQRRLTTLGDALGRVRCRLEELSDLMVNLDCPEDLRITATTEVLVQFSKFVWMSSYFPGLFILSHMAAKSSAEIANRASSYILTDESNHFFTQTSLYIADRLATGIGVVSAFAITVFGNIIKQIGVGIEVVALNKSVNRILEGILAVKTYPKCTYVDELSERLVLLKSQCKMIDGILDNMIFDQSVENS